MLSPDQREALSWFSAPLPRPPFDVRVARELVDLGLLAIDAHRRLRRTIAGQRVYESLIWQKRNLPKYYAIVPHHWSVPKHEAGQNGSSGSVEFSAPEADSLSLSLSLSDHSSRRAGR